MTFSLVSENIVTTAGSVFVVAARDGNINPSTLEGLYAQDTRFLSEFLIKVDGRSLEYLRSGTLNHSLASFYATTPDRGMERHGPLSVVRDRYVSHGMHDDLVIFNHSSEPHQLDLEITLDADFADLFEVRRGTFEKIGECGAEPLPDGQLRLTYARGRFKRETRVVFSPQPEYRGAVARFAPTIAPGTRWKLCASILPVLDREPAPMKCVEEILGPPVGEAALDLSPILLPGADGARGPLEHTPDIDTIHTALNGAYGRAVLDLRSLVIEEEGERYILAAGLPWFMAVFGRDSVISALQTKILGPDLMFGTLETLASYQALEFDEFRESQPGKIPHEIRRGELSHFEEVPHSRYYGSVDATPLFLMLMAEAFRWTGDLGRIKGLLPAAENALNWLDEFGDADGDGFVEYSAIPGKALRNQCWKDSGDSITFADGRLAEGPIAVAEVQGYVYAAKRGVAEIYSALGQDDKAGRLRYEADKLQRRFEVAFWMPDKDFYALALDGDKRRVDSISSNPGHCLWAGMLRPDRAEAVVERLMAPDMFNGWGIRTLSSEMARYHPVSYHNGSVWPHDNSIIAAGFARYGYADRSNELLAGLFDAAAASPDNRLPELFAGYPRRAASFPVPYPAANAPQAWAAGAILYGVEILLRLKPDGDRLISDMPAVSRPLSISGVKYRGRTWGF